MAGVRIFPLRRLKPFEPRVMWQWNGRDLRALVFDVDGTMYPQGPLRRAMILRLVRAYWHSPFRGWITVRTLRKYRRAQESLRFSLSGGVDQLGSAASEERELVRRWIEEEPLKVLRPLVYEGLEKMLAAAKDDGLRLGVFSDYPAEKKLRTLGLEKYFDSIVSAQDPEVQRFKPNALGLEVTLKRLGVVKAEALYVGDRAEVDGAAAAAAGVACVILGAHGFRDYTEIMRMLCLQHM